MQDAIQDIVIVGGGTSGWLSAVLLNRALNGRSATAPYRLTLVESSDIGTIGVGEATIPSIRKTFALCGIDENDWMVRCNASFKLAIKFVDWARPGHVYWHPFGPMPSVDGFELSHYWLKRRLEGRAVPFDASCFSVIPSCEAKRAPRCGDEPPFRGRAIYAYHLDAGLLASYLKQAGIANGVRHIIDNVVHISTDGNGYITSLRTERNGDIHGDLFIDCSGFAGLLINQTLQEPFISFSDSLFCDSAVAIPVPTDDETDGINSYTTATALRAGWAWNIPLYGRSGNGYVYSSACLSRDDAEEELRQFLGPKADTSEARHLRMRVGRTRNSWVKNCVGIGLSGGFIEPLESTAIWFVELGLHNLLYNFPDKTFNPAVIAKYNSVMRKHYEEIRDFIILHYCTTQREDTDFWAANKHHSVLPDSLREDLELWSAMLPNHEKLNDRRFFGNYSYSAILTGMGRLPSRSLPFLDHRDGPHVDAAFQAVRRQGEHLRKTLPDNYKYLTRLRQGDLDEPARQSADELLTVRVT